jgi:hypothetical protein
LGSEIEKIISFIFLRSGKKKLNKTEFYLNLSMDLKWFSPNEAKNLIDLAIKKKSLKVTDNILEPNFEINNIEIPFGYLPNKKKLSDGNSIPEKQYLDITDMIFIKNNYNKIKQEEISKKILSICKEKNLYQNVGSLLIFHNLNVNISEYIKLEEDQIFNE